MKVTIEIDFTTDRGSSVFRPSKRRTPPGKNDGEGRAGHGRSNRAIFARSAHGELAFGLIAKLRVDAEDVRVARY